MLLALAAVGGRKRRPSLSADELDWLEDELEEAEGEPPCDARHPHARLSLTFHLLHC